MTGSQASSRWHREQQYIHLVVVVYGGLLLAVPVARRPRHDPGRGRATTVASHRPGPAPAYFRASTKISTGVGLTAAIWICLRWSWPSFLFGPKKVTQAAIGANSCLRA
jgi:hypothetical protein